MDKGIGDASGKLLVRRIPHNQREEDARPVEAEELRQAEETIETGSKTKLGKLRVSVLVALCRVKMNKVVKTRSAAMEVIEEYVSR